MFIFGFFGWMAIWLVFSICVGAAASARGREGIVWFFVALFFSPLLAILLLLVFPNLKQERLMAEMVRQTRPPAVPPPLPSSAAFEPDGVFAGVPYRIRGDGSIEAIMQGALVRFGDFDRFKGAFDAAQAPQR